MRTACGECSRLLSGDGAAGLTWLIAREASASPVLGLWLAEPVHGLGGVLGGGEDRRERPLAR